MTRTKHLQRHSQLIVQLVEETEKLKQIQWAGDDGAALNLLRNIKNAVIGSTPKKAFYSNSPELVVCLTSILAPRGSPRLKLQAAVVIGSLSYRYPGSLYQVDRRSDLLSNDLISALMACTEESDTALVEASLKALKLLLRRNPGADCPVNLNFVNVLVALLQPPELTMSSKPNTSGINRPNIWASISELAASIIATLAQVCSNETEPQSVILSYITSSPVLTKLLSLLDPSIASFHRTQEAALDAIAQLLKSMPSIGKTFLGLTVAPLVPVNNSKSEERSVGALLRLLKGSKYSMVRLLAAACLSNLYRVNSLENQRVPTQVLLPSVLTILSDTSILSNDLPVAERAPFVFADVLDGSEVLQKLALEGGAVAKLASFLDTKELCAAVLVGKIGKSSDIRLDLATLADSMSVDDNAGKSKLGIGKAKVTDEQATILTDTGITNPKTYEKVAEGCLLAVASLTALREDCRKLVIDSNILPLIVVALSHPSDSLRIAAAKCTRSLSRSVKNLRTSLVDAGVVHPLLKLLDDKENIDVTVDATATLCNVVLDFSPLKKTVLDEGGVEKLVSLLNQVYIPPELESRYSKTYELKLNCVWALKNLLYQASTEIKTKVMKCLGWDSLKRLIFDSKIGIQEQALNLLRNLVCGRIEDIESVVNGFGVDSLLAIFQKKLVELTISTPSENDVVILQTLYVVVNIATGHEKHKGLLIEIDGLLTSISYFMNHEKALIRLATVWCIINLTETDDSNPQAAQSRIDRVKSFGILSHLNRMVHDPDPDVRERVKVALSNMGFSEETNALGRGFNQNQGDDGDDTMMDVEGMRDMSTYLAERGL